MAKWMCLVSPNPIEVRMVRLGADEQMYLVSGVSLQDWESFPDETKEAILKGADDDWYYGSASWLSKLLNAVNDYRDAHSRHESGEAVNLNDPYAQMLVVADEIQKWRDED